MELRSSVWFWKENGESQDEHMQSWANRGYRLAGYSVASAADQILAQDFRQNVAGYYEVTNDHFHHFVWQKD